MIKKNNNNKKICLIHQMMNSAFILFLFIKFDNGTNKCHKAHICPNSLQFNRSYVCYLHFYFILLFIIDVYC